MNSPRVGIAILVLLATCAVPSGCGSAGPGLHAGERYVVNSERTLFYKYGPVQSTGPDFALYKGQILTMLSRDFGYSHVSAGGQSGYVSTEDIVPAPPELKPEPTPQLAARSGGGAGARSKPGGVSTPGGRRPTRNEEAAVPAPDLPQSKPSTPPPTFRY